MKLLKLTVCIFILTITISGFSQSKIDIVLNEISTATSAERIENDLKTLVNFGTRHTMSDTISSKRGIGAARRWIKGSFDKVSKDCNGCLEVKYIGDLVKNDGRRITKDTKVVNVVAIQRGSKYPNRFVIMSGDIDSRVSNANNYTFGGRARALWR